MTSFATTHASDIADRSSFIYRMTKKRFPDASMIRTFHEDAPVTLSSNHAYVTDVIIEYSRGQTYARVLHNYVTNNLEIVFYEDQSEDNQENWFFLDGAPHVTSSTP